ncbi:hypothetical protein AVEN_246450-1 [Araneus ventricosus]|uniref:Uncharacterized protein n=1 Tax=Araneus ventricosus TaxID=182803 RepID=A0A4Y2EPG4_ARAVE|nr:hypothetical protein AVEN_246450-1 [Araneus ventricosus]
MGGFRPTFIISTSPVSIPAAVGALGVLNIILRNILIQELTGKNYVSMRIIPHPFLGTNSIWCSSKKSLKLWTRLSRRLKVLWLIFLLIPCLLDMVLLFNPLDM